VRRRSRAEHCSSNPPQASPACQEETNYSWFQAHLQPKGRRTQFFLERCQMNFLSPPPKLITEHDHLFILRPPILLQRIRTLILSLLLCRFARILAGPKGVPTLPSIATLSCLDVALEGDPPCQYGHAGVSPLRLPHIS